MLLLLQAVALQQNNALLIYEILKNCTFQNYTGTYIHTPVRVYCKFTVHTPIYSLRRVGLGHQFD